MLTRKPKSMSGLDALIFYSQRLTLLMSDINGIKAIWQECENPKSVEVSGFGDEALVSCNKQELDDPCASCLVNKEIYKEKRRLKSQISKAMVSISQYSVKEPKLCIKESPSFVDGMDINEGYYR